MAKRITPQEIVEMHRLYNIYGTFAEVGRRMGRSASSVAKYIKLQGTPSIVRHTFKEVVRVLGEKMKKIIVLILALIMVLGLVGCSSVPAEEATNTPQSPEGTTQTPESEEDSSVSIKLGVPVTAGNWEYTLVGIEFAKDVITSLEYENFLVPGSDPSLTNPLGLEEDEMLAVVTYKLKMIGKEVQSVWDKDVYNTVGTGKFIFGDGFVFENDTVGDRAEPYYFNGTVFEDMAFMSLEPLSEEIECRVAFCVPSKVVENTSEPLVYEIAFGETGDNMMFTYTIR